MHAGYQPRGDLPRADDQTCGGSALIRQREGGLPCTGDRQRRGSNAPGIGSARGACGTGLAGDRPRAGDQLQHCCSGIVPGRGIKRAGKRRQDPDAVGGPCHLICQCLVRVT